MQEENLVEYIISDLSEVKIVVRPNLPFSPEGFRITGGSTEIFGEGKRISLKIPEEHIENMSECEGLLFIEYGRSGSSYERQTDLLRDEATV